MFANKYYACRWTTVKSKTIQPSNDCRTPKSTTKPTGDMPWRGKIDTSHKNPVAWTYEDASDAQAWHTHSNNLQKRTHVHIGKNVRKHMYNSRCIPSANVHNNMHTNTSMHNHQHRTMYSLIHHMHKHMHNNMNNLIGTGTSQGMH
ncbi:MAG: hypothetical protein ACKPKO_48810, partial [Candidatus Fonsibacter sp.]